MDFERVDVPYCNVPAEQRKPRIANAFRKLTRSLYWWVPNLKHDHLHPGHLDFVRFAGPAGESPCAELPLFTLLDQIIHLGLWGVVLGPHVHSNTPFIRSLFRKATGVHTLTCRSVASFRISSTMPVPVQLSVQPCRLLRAVPRSFTSSCGRGTENCDQINTSFVHIMQKQKTPCQLSTLLNFATWRSVCRSFQQERHLLQSPQQLLLLEVGLARHAKGSIFRLTWLRFRDFQKVSGCKRSCADGLGPIRACSQLLDESSTCL